MENDEVIPYVGMAWGSEEYTNVEDVLDGCLLVVANTHEEAYDEITHQIELIGQNVEECTIVIRRAK